MAQITLGGNPINTGGNLPATGSKAPDFVLTNTSLADVSLKDFSGKKVILNIFPSLDTDVCAASVRRFNAEANKLGNTAVLCVSADLPFAMKRFCGAEGLDNVVALSAMRNRDFGKGYGISIVDGPLAGVFGRAIVVLDESGSVTYTQLVPEIKEEPNYDEALAAVK